MTAPLATTVPITLGTPVNLTPPSSSMNIGSVVIANHSSYVVSVTTGADQFALSPYSKDVFDLGRGAQPVGINSSNPEGAPNTLPAYLIAEWYSTDDKPPAAAYPVALTASPYAIAAQTGLSVAQQLLAQGVPNVLLQEAIAGFPVSIAPFGSVGPIAIGKYASVQLLIASASTTNLQLIQTADVGGFQPVDVEYFSNFLANVTACARWAVTGPYLFINNQNSAGANVSVLALGSNRPAVYRFDARSQSAGQPLNVAGTTTAIAGTDNNLASGNVGPAPQLHGPCYADFLSGSGAITGYFVARTAAGDNVILCDTAEMVAGASGTLQASKQVSLPAISTALGIQFHQTNNVVASVRARFSSMLM